MKKSRLKKVMPVISAIIFAVLSLIIAAGVGSVHASAADVVSIIAFKLFGAPLSEGITDSLISIVWEIRLPRVFSAFFVGALLSVSGAIVQSLLQNPLASSYTLGVSSGASLGVGLVVVAEFESATLGFLLLPTVGFLFGLGTVLLVIMFSSRLDGNLRSHTIILFGMITSLFTNACLTLLMSANHNHMQRLLMWQMGSFAGRRWTHVSVLCIISLICLLLAMTYHRQLDIMSFGDELSMGNGVDTKKGRMILLILASVMTGAAVCFTGVIGFIDLAAPHAVRKIFGASHEYVIPMSALVGGAFMVLSDLASRMLLSPQEIPVGAVTALLGAPFFMFIYFGGGKTGTPRQKTE